MAFNGRYKFKSTVADYAFKFGMFLLAVNLIAWITTIGVSAFFVAVAIICLGFAYFMEKEMSKK